MSIGKWWASILWSLFKYDRRARPRYVYILDTKSDVEHVYDLNDTELK